MVKRILVCSIMLALLSNCAFSESSFFSYGKNDHSQKSKKIEKDRENAFDDWMKLYKKNKSFIDDFSACVFENKQNVVVGIYNYDADGKYATIGVEGFADEYVVTEELKKTLYLNFERNLKRKEIKKKTNTDRIDLSKISVSTPSEGFGIVFENDSIVAVSPQIVGDFDLSDSFVRNFNSCVNRFNIHF